MLKRSLVACVITAGLGLMPFATLQADTQGQKPAASSSSPITVHFEGCLFTEPALTATMPIVVPSGVPQTWVLTGAKVIAGPMKDADVEKQIYVLTTVEQDQARAFYGKRVGIVGRVGKGATHPTLDVISIRDISGGCPVLPNLP